jgi:hypothetical protein
MDAGVSWHLTTREDVLEWRLVTTAPRPPFRAPPALPLPQHFTTGALFPDRHCYRRKKSTLLSRGPLSRIGLAHYVRHVIVRTLSIRARNVLGAVAALMQRHLGGGAPRPIDCVWHPFRLRGHYAPRGLTRHMLITNVANFAPDLCEEIDPAGRVSRLDYFVMRILFMNERR